MAPALAELPIETKEVTDHTPDAIPPKAIDDETHAVQLDTWKKFSELWQVNLNSRSGR